MRVKTSDPLRTPHGHYFRTVTSGAHPKLVQRWNEACARLEAQEQACDAAQPCHWRGGEDRPCPCDGGTTAAPEARTP